MGVTPANYAVQPSTSRLRVDRGCSGRALRAVSADGERYAGENYEMVAHLGSVA